MYLEKKQGKNSPSHQPTTHCRIKSEKDWKVNEIESRGRFKYTDRFFEEKKWQFRIDQDSLEKDILRGEWFLFCPDGVSGSSIKIAQSIKKTGVDITEKKEGTGGVISMDILYRHPVKELKKLAKKLMERKKHNGWSDEWRIFYDNIQEALKNGLCMPANAAYLPVRDNFFKESYHSGLLPMYSCRLGSEIHDAIIDEKIRVTREKAYFFPLKDVDGLRAASDGLAIRELLRVSKNPRKDTLHMEASPYVDWTLERLNQPSSPVTAELYEVSAIDSHGVISYHYGMVINKKKK